MAGGAQDLPAVHPLDARDYRDRSSLIEALTLASGQEWIVGGPDDPELVDVGFVEAGFFEFFGAHALHGRTFGADDGRHPPRGAPDVRLIRGRGRPVCATETKHRNDLLSSASCRIDGGLTARVQEFKGSRVARSGVRRFEQASPP